MGRGKVAIRTVRSLTDMGGMHGVDLLTGVARFAERLFCQPQTLRVNLVAS